MIFTGIFAKDVGLIYGNTETFKYHIIALVLVSIFAFFGSYFLYYITDKIIPIRVNSLQEEEGLDISQHQEQASDNGITEVSPVNEGLSRAS
jgi:Amt family ammonium transporter